MKIRIFGCIMLSFWLLCSTHHRVAFALSESDILKVIATQDKALNQGSIELSKTSAQLYNSKKSVRANRIKWGTIAADEATESEA